MSKNEMSEIDLLIVMLKDRIKSAQDVGLKTQIEYEKVLAEAAKIRVYKVVQYGEERLEEKDADLNLWMLYCDIWRKFSRLKRMIRNILKNGDPDSIKKLRSDCLDMLNYGAMGVQIIDRLGEISKKEG